MEAKHTQKRHMQFLIILSSIGLLFSGFLIVDAFQESRIYDTLEGKSASYLDSQSSLGKRVSEIQKTLEADEAVKRHDYQEALQLITGTTSQDYYNRGTLQTMIAYQNALQSSISGLQQAQIYISQAQQNLDIAKKLKGSKTLDDAIIGNESAIQSLSTVVDIKTCYGIGQLIVIGINDITSIIKGIQGTIDQETEYIQKRAGSLDATCYQKLLDIADTSKGQVQLLNLQMQENRKKHIADLSDKIEDPMHCIQTPYENILPSINKGRQGLNEYQQLHQNTIEALKSDDSQSIKELCNQSKNDAQINQEIEDSVQELLQKLENTTGSQARASNEAEYKDFFDKDEKKALQEIKDINKTRINNTLQIKGQGNYHPERYIDDMFNQFYGNSGDFVDLHK